MLNLLELARKYKQEGNELFKAGDLKKARTKYSRVFPYTKTLSGGPGSDQMVAMAMKVRLIFHNNIKDLGMNLSILI